MKRIIFYLLSCLFFQQALSMNRNGFEIVTLDESKEPLIINSYEALSMVATGLRGCYDDVAKTYDVKPQAIAEYFSFIEKKQSSVDCCSLAWCRKQQKKYPEVYNEIVIEVLDQIYKQSSGEFNNVLPQIRQRFQAHVIEKESKIEKKIEDIMPEYDEKRNCYRCQTGTTAILGLLLLGEWTTIALFSWVIDHCGHPWA